MEYLTFLKIMHLTGLVIGMGGALYADYLIITGGIFRPLQKETLNQVKRLSHIVIYGLVLLWFSGAALTAEAIRINPEFIGNEKFWAKMVIVVLLTINGFLVHHFVLKHAEESLNQRLLIDSSTPVVLLLATCGSVSFISWVTPFILGKAPEFSYIVPFEVIMTLWVMAIATSVAGVLTFVALQSFWANYDHTAKQPG